MDFLTGTRLLLGCKTQLFRGVELLWDDTFGDCSDPVNIAIYPYRSAAVTAKGRIAIPRLALKEFEHRVCKACGTEADNHTVIGLETGSLSDGGSNTLYFWFTDAMVFIGHQIEFNEDRGLEFPVRVTNKHIDIKPPVQTGQFNSLPTGV